MASAIVRPGAVAGAAPPEALEFVVPAGWRSLDVPHATALLRPARDAGWFRTNVLLTHARVPPSLDLGAIAEAAIRHLRSRRVELEVLGQDRGALVEADRVARLVCFDAVARDVRVAQLHVLVARPGHPGRSPRDVAEIVATCALDDLDRYGDAFAEVVRSIRFV
jgi:hypothetical protein